MPIPKNGVILHASRKPDIVAVAEYNSELGIRVTLHTSTRVPVDDAYVALVGKAVYVFAYYEWAIICIVEILRAGFVGDYSRGKPMTSGNVKDQFQSAIYDLPADFRKVSEVDLQRICDEFERLIVTRNALIHAHPVTDFDRAQILAYQTAVAKPLPDMIWPTSEVISIIAVFDSAACEACSILDRLR